MGELLRPRSGRMIGGVCTAIANRFDMSVTIVRALTVIAVLFFGLGVWIYLLLWLLIPLDRR
jgi:phage shock protein C